MVWWNYAVAHLGADIDQESTFTRVKEAQNAMKEDE